MTAQIGDYVEHISRILNTPTHTDTYPELKVICDNLELREALERLVSWMKVFEVPTWTDEFLNREGDASLRWYEAAQAALASTS